MAWGMTTAWHTTQPFKIMNNRITDFTQWFYFHPIFSESEVENSGWSGLIKSGVNLAVWAAVVGIVAHVAGSTRAKTWAVGFFVAAVAGEILFGLSGPSTTGHHIQMGNTAAPATGAPNPPWAGTPGRPAAGYAESGNFNFAQENNLYR
jgi:hypothetical protein